MKHYVKKKDREEFRFPFASDIIREMVKQGAEDERNREKDIKNHRNLLCPHCGRRIIDYNYMRHHGDKCKYKEEE